VEAAPAAVPQAVPVAAVDLRTIPVAAVDLRTIPVAAVDLRTIPVAAVAVRVDPAVGVLPVVPQADRVGVPRVLIQILAAKFRLAIRVGEPRLPAHIRGYHCIGEHLAAQQRTRRARHEFLFDWVDA